MYLSAAVLAQAFLLVKSLGLDMAMNFKSPVKCLSRRIFCSRICERSEQPFGRGYGARSRVPENFTKTASFPAFWCIFSDCSRSYFFHFQINFFLNILVARWRPVIFLVFSLFFFSTDANRHF
jgi:hypothetical protein